MPSPRAALWRAASLRPPRSLGALARWLVRLRWAAIAAQVIVLALATWWLQIPMPAALVVGLLLFEISSNAALGAWLRRRDEPPEALIAAVMAVDVGLLTVLLQVTGGPFNPFCFLYLVHVALAALTLRPRLAWGLLGLALGAYGLLFSPWLWDPHAHHMHHGGALRLHLEGMWWALAITALLLVGFAVQLRRALAEREAELVLSRQRQQRQERLASLATLAAGAAHELATPLSTIAVVAKELERALRGADEALIEDARLVSAEVARCRAVLQQLSIDAGALMGEQPQSRRVVAWVEEALAGFEHEARVQVQLAPLASAASIVAPPSALAQVLRGLLRNATQASATTITLDVSLEPPATLIVEVRDTGHGMDRELLARAMEPFFTTRPTGQGMGLGLFLAHNLIERLGGALSLRSTPGQGTVARITLPCELAHDDPPSA